MRPEWLCRVSHVVSDRTFLVLRVIVTSLHCVHHQMKDPEMETEDVRRTIFSVAAQYGLVQG